MRQTVAKKNPGLNQTMNLDNGYSSSPENGSPLCEVCE